MQSVKCMCMQLIFQHFLASILTYTCIFLCNLYMEKYGIYTSSSKLLYQYIFLQMDAAILYVYAYLKGMSPYIRY